MRDLGLADRIRAKGVTVVEVAGWQSRGIDVATTGATFRPIGALLHHTAGAASGTAGSLSTCTNGRPDVDGPLCQVLQSREPDPADDKAYVIASGKANHGGNGSWTGAAGTMDSNYESEGLEVEHTGTSSVPAARLEISARIIAAMLEAPGSSRSATMACQHSEYALPAGRKIDFADLAPHHTRASFRARVAYWIGRTAEEEDDMFGDADRNDLKSAKADAMAGKDYAIAARNAANAATAKADAALFVCSALLDLFTPNGFRHVDVTDEAWPTVAPGTPGAKPVADVVRWARETVLAARAELADEPTEDAEEAGLTMSVAELIAAVQALAPPAPPADPGDG